MPRKRVGITCSTNGYKAPPEPPRSFVNNAYVRAIEGAGGLPLLLPATADPETLQGWLGVIDGILFTGGVDVDPAEYGQARHPKLGEVDVARDATELPLLRRALAQDVPLFAICRGIQALNIACGGTLWQDIPAQIPSEIVHEQKQPRDALTHSVRFEQGGRIRAIVGAETLRTNSFHHQALQEVGAGLVVTARAQDGVIEAVEGTQNRFVIGVQFHPEEMVGVSEGARRLFAAFVAAL